MWALNTDYRLERQPDSAHQTLVPSQNFPTKDGHIVIMCMKEKFWQRLTGRLGMPTLQADPRFRAFQDRLTHRHELIQLLEEVLRTKTTDQWLAILRGHVPCAPVYDVEQALRDEQVLAREMVITVDHPRFGPLREVGCPIKIDDVRPRYRPASRVGADTDELLHDLLGLSHTEIERLRERGAI